MPTEKQIAANRRNAQRSTGPKTEEGKRHSSLNAYKHGITGQRIIMTAEECEARIRFTDGFFADLKPVGAMERNLVQSIADSQWRIHRAVAIEDNIFAFEAWHEEARAAEKQYDYDGVDRALAPMRSFIENPKRFHLLTTYEMRLHRKAAADLKQLRELQAARRAAAIEGNEEATPAPLPEPTLVATQTAESAAAKTPNGFVFSTPPLSVAEMEKILNEDLTPWLRQTADGVSNRTETV